MISIRDISIKNKLVLMQVITSVVVLGLCFMAFVINDIRGYKERKINGTIGFAQVIGTNSVSALQFMDNEAAALILSELQEVETDVTNSAIFDAEGKIFAEFNRADKPTHRFVPPFNNRHQILDDHLYVYKTIVDNAGNHIGTVCLEVELSELEDIISEKYQIAFVLFVVGISLAFLLAYLNQRYISAPIMNLVDVMQDIRAKNDYNRQVKVTGHDEISVLSAEFNNLMNEVAQSHQKKDEFIGIASHELKTPLTSVKLYLESLSKMKHDKLSETFINKAKEGVNKLHNLILDLLDVSKIESGQLQLNERKLDLNELVDECIQDQQMSFTSHKIIRSGSTEASMVLGDKDRLEQVVINLISNAIKYSPDETRIHVETSNSNGFVTVSVTDFGIGILESEHKKIFGRFYRSREGNAVTSGFGLGLYICAQIIKRHNGSIGVESTEGKGSRFFFQVPMTGESIK